MQGPSCVHFSFIGRVDIMVGLACLHHFQLYRHPQLANWASTCVARCQMAILAWQWILALVHALCRAKNMHSGYSGGPGHPGDQPASRHQYA